MKCGHMYIFHLFKIYTSSYVFANSKYSVLALSMKCRCISSETCDIECDYQMNACVNSVVKRYEI